MHELVQVIANPPKDKKCFLLCRLLPLLEEFYDDVWELYNFKDPKAPKPAKLEKIFRYIYFLRGDVEDIVEEIVEAL